MCFFSLANGTQMRLSKGYKPRRRALGSDRWTVVTISDTAYSAMREIEQHHRDGETFARSTDDTLRNNGPVQTKGQSQSTLPYLLVLAVRSLGGPTVVILWTGCASRPTYYEENTQDRITSVASTIRWTCAQGTTER
jgi:hypothetical protein